jgi:hypothetical protein
MEVALLPSGLVESLTVAQQQAPRDVLLVNVFLFQITVTHQTYKETLAQLLRIDVLMVYVVQLALHTMVVLDQSQCNVLMEPALRMQDLPAAKVAVENVTQANTCVLMDHVCQILYLAPTI